MDRENCVFIAVTSVTVYTFPVVNVNAVPVTVQLVPQASDMRIVGAGLG